MWGGMSIVTSRTGRKWRDHAKTDFEREVRAKYFFTKRRNTWKVQLAEGGGGGGGKQYYEGETYQAKIKKQGKKKISKYIYIGTYTHTLKAVKVCKPYLIPNKNYQKEVKSGSRTGYRLTNFNYEHAYKPTVTGHTRGLFKGAEQGLGNR